MSEVFLSYKREDLKAATKLVDALRGFGLHVWWDRDIPPADPWEATIERSLAEAEVVLVCWSRAAVASENVRSEARWARDRARLIQLFLEPCSPPLFFGERQGIDLSDWSGDPADVRLHDLVAVLKARFDVPSDKSSPTPAAFEIKADKRRLPRNVLWIVAFVIALLILLGIGVRRYQNRSLTPARPQRIAILPFDVVGPTPKLNEFASNLGNSLQSALSSAPVQTVPPSDAATLTGADEERKAKALNVGLVLGGAVRGVGDQYVVHLTLDDPIQHTTLWTLDKSGAATSPDSLQAQVGAAAVAVMTCAAEALRPKGGLLDSSALALFLRACGIEQTQILDPLHVDSLLDTMRQVTAQAPDSAVGHAYLAAFIGYLYDVYPEDQRPQLLAEAGHEAKRALAIDPEEATAYAAFDLIQPLRSWTKREALLRKGLVADAASPHVNGLMGVLLMEVGRLKEARSYFERAVAANPQSNDWPIAFPWMYAGSASEDDKNLARYATLWPDLGSAIWPNQMLNLVQEGRWDDATTLIEQTPSSVSRTTAECYGLLVQVGKSRKPFDASIAADAFTKGKCSAGGASDPTAYLALVGRVDEAFALAQRAAQDAMSSPAFLFMPATEGMRRDRRFMPLAAKFGLVRYWRSSGKWPDFCSNPGLPYDCKAEAAMAQLRV